MHNIIIADTSCFVILTKINQLHLLKDLYGTIYTTSNIAAEFNEPLPDWVIVSTVADQQRKVHFEQQVDEGEASAIALALELSNPTIILDDLKARKFAESLGLSITGTLGIIAKAKIEGIIPSIIPLIEKIKSTNFRLSSTVIKIALKDAGEEL